MLESIENVLKLRINAHNIRVLCAELIGTCMIVLFGCGSVCASLSGAYKGLWQIAVIWGLGVSFAIYCTASISNAHLNPAVSLAFFLWRPNGSFKLECTDLEGWERSGKSNTISVRVAPKLDTTNGSYKNRVLSCLQMYLDLLPSLLMYSLFQLFGGILGGIINLGIYKSTIESFERKNNITRGDEKSILTAKAFGEYFPNPDLSTKFNDGIYQQTDVSIAHALFIEAWGTFILVFVIFVLTNAKNGAVKMKFGADRAEDMKKNMYCVCVELEDNENNTSPEEQGILLEDVNEHMPKQNITNGDKIDDDQISIPISKGSCMPGTQNVPVEHLCRPLSIEPTTKTYPSVQSIPSVVIPGLIGFTVAMLLALYAPLTQAGWNPARDFGPRVVAYFAGWGKVAIPGPRGGFWVYIIGPYIGGIIAGWFSEKLFYGFKS